MIQSKCADFSKLYPEKKTSPESVMCFRYSEDAYYKRNINVHCTREKGHFGQHHAHGVSACFAIWGRSDNPPFVYGMSEEGE